jgi:hypothetical protein
MIGPEAYLETEHHEGTVAIAVNQPRREQSIRRVRVEPARGLLRPKGQKRKVPGGTMFSRMRQFTQLAHSRGVDSRGKRPDSVNLDHAWLDQSRMN